MNTETMPRSTRALLGLLEHSAPGPTLDVGSYQGAVAEVAGCTYVHVDLTACEAARAAGVTSVIHSDMLPAGPFGTVVFDAREYDPALAAEMVAQAAIRLAPDGVVLTTARAADVAVVFDEVVEDGEAVIGRGPRPGGFRPDWPVYQAQFQGLAYQVQSLPGVFSPRGLDEGTAFMLGRIEPKEGAHFLDLGCGIGIVSKIASETWGCSVTAVDVNARALRLTATNAPRAEVLASDGFRQLGAREFDIIASNPPYHTDFAVGKAFIEGAYRHLAMGGQLYLVVKRADWYIEKVRTVFGGCRVAQEGGYTLITTEKRPQVPTRKSEPTTTKKHAKRMAATAKKGGPRR